MTSLWVAYALLTGVLLATALPPVDRAARLLRLPTRFIWLAGMTAALALPFSASLRAPGAMAPTQAAGVALLPAIVVDAGAAAGDAIERTARRAPGSLGTIALGLWVAMSLLAFARIAAGLATLRRERRQWARVTRDGIPLLVADARGPAVIGIARSEIVVPPWVLDLPDESRALVLQHELEHVQARDAALRTVAAVLLALAPWNPALHWMSGRLAFAVEKDCDDRVLRRGADPSLYARLLVLIASRASRPQLVPALTERTSHLERRIIAMRHRHPNFPRARAGLLALVGIAVVVVACAMPVPSVHASPAPVERATVADTAYFEFQVDSQVSPATGRAPVYPAEQRTANVEGEVIAQFIVDTTGVAEMTTFRVLRSSHEAFTASVRTAVAGMTFRPAWRRGVKVRQVVQMPFLFAVSR